MAQFVFGFATVRNPSTIGEDARNLHVRLNEQDREATRLWSGLEVADFPALRREIVSRIRSGAFVAPPLREIQTEHRRLIALYRDVASEARRTSLEGLAAGDTEPLSRDERVALWDGLGFYLWGRRAREEVDVISAILVADRVLAELRVLGADGADLSEADQVRVRRVARGRVVLPLRTDNRLSASAPRHLSAAQRRMLLAAHDQIVHRGALRQLEDVRSDLELALAVSRGQRASDDVARDESRRSTLNETLARHVASDALPGVVERLSATLRAERSGPVEAELLTSLLRTETARSLVTAAPMLSGNLVLSGIEEQIDDATDALEPQIFAVETSTLLAFGTEFTIEERIPEGALALKLHRQSEGGYHLFATYHHGTGRAPLGIVSGTLATATGTQPIRSEIVLEEEPDFQTFRLTETPVEAPYVDVSLTLLSLDIGAVAVSLDPMRLFASQAHMQLTDLTLDEGEEVDPPPILYGVTRLGMIEYRRVEQELSCYVTGEIARIENILASEYKERVSRSLSAIETEQEVTQELASEMQTDTSTSETSSMQSEVSEVLRAERQKTYDAGVSVTAGLQGIGEMSSDFGFHHNTLKSSEESTSEAIEIARSVTRKVQERLLQKTTNRRRSMSRREFEDINKHGFDNRQNPNHVVGVHRFVDKVYTHRLVNLGAREMLEIVLPEPAKAFIFAQSQSRDEEEQVSVRRPKRPRRIGLRGPESVNASNWRKFAATYGITLDPPPPRSITLSRGFADTAPPRSSGEDAPDPDALDDLMHGRAAAYNEIEIPDGYVATQANIRWTSYDFIGDGFHTVQVIVGGGDQVGGFRGDEDVELPRIAEMLPVVIQTGGSEAYAVTITVTCKRRRATLREWQMQSHAALMEAYRTQKAAFDAARDKMEREQEELDLNPRFKRRHMERELKRLCIEMLTNRFGVQTSADHYEPDDGDTFPKMRQGIDLVRHSEVVKFFEQAFDWTIMSYIFYPYFYGPKADWSVKLSLEATRNHLFASFLSSGMARVMLPVRRGMEDAVNFYLDTGQVWFGTGLVLDSANDLYLSIADELLSASDREQVIEQTWETQLPTSHTILQSEASALIESGLPCHDAGARIGDGPSTLTPVVPLSPVDGG